MFSSYHFDDELHDFFFICLEQFKYLFSCEETNEF